MRGCGKAHYRGTLGVEPTLVEMVMLSHTFEKAQFVHIGVATYPAEGALVGASKRKVFYAAKYREESASGSWSTAMAQERHR